MTDIQLITNTIHFGITTAGIVLLALISNRKKELNDRPKATEAEQEDDQEDLNQDEDSVWMTKKEWSRRSARIRLRQARAQRRSDQMEQDRKELETMLRKRAQQPKEKTEATPTSTSLALYEAKPVMTEQEWLDKSIKVKETPAPVSVVTTSTCTRKEWEIKQENRTLTDAEWAEIAEE